MSAEEELTALPRAELKARWQDVFGSKPAPRLSSKMMTRILACERQWTTSAQPRAQIRRQLRKAAKDSETAKPAAREGTRLVRTWHGQEHVVDVVEEGYLWGGRQWTSLSAIAREITGTKWSGPRFFGVRA